MVDRKDLISQMTLEEKASLMSGRDFWSTRSISRLNISHMFMADGPHGLRKQASKGDHLGLVQGIKATCFPTSATVANSWDVELCNEIGMALGKEAAANDVNILLGPGLNTKRNPLCGRNFEYFSEDPYLSGKLAAAYIKGIQKIGVGACPKHFAANNQEHLRMTNDSVVDDRTLHELYLTGFEIAVKEGKPKAIMSAYNKVNGIYANENHYLLQEVLVDKWGFDGIVISDWGGSNNPVDSVQAGSHIEMPTPGKDSIERIIAAVDKHELEEECLSSRIESYLKVLNETEIKEKTAVEYAQHHLLAQKAAQESTVLLKNNEVLPLEVGTKIALIGDFAEMPRYQGGGSSMVNAYKLESTLGVIYDTSINLIGFAKGFERNGKVNEPLMNDAVELANKADVAIVYVGLNEIDEMEGRDRTHMKIGDNQIKLIQEIANTDSKLVVVISGGAVIEMPWEQECDAILHGYLSGQAGAKAILNILTGTVNPSGKLSETYPIVYEDSPNYSYYPGKELTSEYREGIYVGYRYYDKAGIDVKYPFGYGLSYTNFSYNDLVVTKKGATCKITNTGCVAGSEIVQLYIGRNQEGVHRPEKELKGFAKVYLEAGQSKEITIDFDEYSFRYYDTVNRCFEVQDGEYQILIGSSSKDIRLKGFRNIKGKILPKEDINGLEKYFSGSVKDIRAKEFEKLYGRNLPESKWDRKKPLEINDSFSQMFYSKSILARILCKTLVRLKNRADKKGKPDLNLYFIANMPFRAIAKLSNGKVSLEMTEHIAYIANGHFFKGVARLIKSFLNYKRRSDSH